MGDLFHEDVPYDFILDVFNVIAQAPHCTFQILTKRPERMRVVLDRIQEGWDDDITWTGDYPYYAFGALSQWPWPHVWLGVTAENQRQADERIPHLLNTPAALRFVSIEPMLGPVGLQSLESNNGRLDAIGGEWEGCEARDMGHEPIGWPTNSIDWVIVGGESGPGARPFKAQWALDVIEQCKAAGVPVFMKQLGSYTARSTGQRGKMGDPGGWIEELRVREWPR
jgi:protein gp37